MTYESYIIERMCNISLNQGTAGVSGFQLERDPREDSVECGTEGSFGGGANSLSGESSGYLSGNWEQEPEVKLSLRVFLSSMI